MKPIWSYTLAWLLAASAAVAMASAAPSELSVMGQLPSFTGQTLDRQAIAVPEGLPADRTLALITFRGTQKPHIDSWIQGLNLRADRSIVWMRMPVLDDPGSTAGRQAVEAKLLQRYPGQAERANLVPVFTNRAQFLRSAGLNGPDQVYAVVVNRQGEVLARAEGAFDADRAQNLRETLQQQGL